ncbi:MAG: lipid A core-O-antigen ligase-like enyme [Candidatus Atelocyanobacterium thalassa isolate SIO64986]|uniref:Lipid A core-O-antigen ligase-like enyme n=1 Tax=Candidatus Atelocyanobacterium thalassa isolate SIO64986 TaxID=1527444 RepID=A0A086CG54_9CHRO|nr:MAG: lipid A core-O-antigen ligase-like enyme [Candidatus Atelocyanobacterium thalassa isolate SIO64986]
MKQLKNPNFLWSEYLLKAGIIFLPISADLGAIFLSLLILNLWKQKYKSIIYEPLNWSFGILFIWLIFISTIAIYPILSFEGLANFIPSILMVVSFPFLLNSYNRLYNLAWWLVLVSLPICFLGFMQLFYGWETPFLLKKVGIQLIAYGRPEGRVSSFLMYANTLAFYLVTTFTLSIGLWIYHYQSWKILSNYQTKLQLATLSVAVFINGFGIVLTHSRSAWGLALLSLTAFIAYLELYWFLSFIVLLVFLIAWAAWLPFYQNIIRGIIPDYFWARLTDELYDDRHITALRTTQWSVAWQMMLSRPFWGWGLRNFTPIYQQKMNVWMGHPHNLFLMLLSEIGIFGTSLLSIIVATILGKATMILIKTKQIYSNYISLDTSIDTKNLLLFTYLNAFILCTIFNLFDVSIFDLKINVIGWLLLSSIIGVTYQSKSSN